MPDAAVRSEYYKSEIADTPVRDWLVSVDGVDDAELRSVVLAACAAVAAVQCATAEEEEGIVAGDGASARVEAAPCIFESAYGNIPRVPLIEYTVMRLVRYMKPTVHAFAMAIASLDRVLALRTPRARLCCRSQHRLLATALHLALLMSTDRVQRLMYYANVVGVTQREMRSLHVELLELLGFYAWPGSVVCDEYEAALVAAGPLAATAIDAARSGLAISHPDQSKVAYREDFPMHPR
jgi:hypothetical protein